MKSTLQSSHKALLVLLLMVALLSTHSCTRTEEIRDTPMGSSLKEDSPKQKASIEDRTVQLFTSLYASTLRNGASPSISSLDSTETAAPETKLYLANFSGGGFMLFRDGGNEEMEVLGHSDESSLHFSDAEENPILNQIFRASAKLSAPGSTIPIPKPSPFPDPNPDPNPRPFPDLPPDFADYPKTVVEHESAPYIKKTFEPETYEYFNQNRPFNCYISKWSIPSNNIAAGCGPIAIATILSHYEMQAGGSKVDWKLLKERYNRSYDEEPKLEDETELIHQLRILIKNIWDDAHVWSTGFFTMSIPSNISSYLRRIGFNVTYEKSYNANTIYGILKEKHQPVILLGWCRDDNSKSAHYWVVDGLAEQMKKQVGYTQATPTSDREPFENEVSVNAFIHCTWGWGGSWNAWFSPRIINYKEGISDSELRSTHPKGEYYDISIFHIWK